MIPLQDMNRKTSPQSDDLVSCPCDFLKVYFVEKEKGCQRQNNKKEEKKGGDTGSLMHEHVMPPMKI